MSDQEEHVHNVQELNGAVFIDGIQVVLAHASFDVLEILREHFRKDFIEDFTEGGVGMLEEGEEVVPLTLKDTKPQRLVGIFTMGGFIVEEFADRSFFVKHRDLPKDPGCYFSSPQSASLATNGDNQLVVASAHAALKADSARLADKRLDGDVLMDDDGNVLVVNRKDPFSPPYAGDLTGYRKAHDRYPHRIGNIHDLREAFKNDGRG